MQITNGFIYQQRRHGKVQVCAYASIYTICFVSSPSANLDHYREPLKEVGKRVGLTCGWLQSSTKVTETTNGIWTNHTADFHCNWLKLIGLVQVSVLLRFLSLCMRRYSTRFFGRCLILGVVKNVHTGGIPHQETPIWPGNHGHPHQGTFRQFL